MARGKKTIVQRIALDGGKEIEAEFKQLGAAGERAFAQLRAAAQKSQNLSPLANAIANVKRQFASLNETTGGFRDGLTNIGTGIATAARSLFLLKSAALAAEVGLANIIKGAAGAADELGKNAQSAGLTIEQYQALEYAAGQSGVEAEVFAKGMVRINDAIAEAAKKSEAALTDLADNGIRAVQSFDQFDGNSVKVVKLGSAMDETRKKAADLGQTFVNGFGAVGVTLRVAGQKVKQLEGPLGALQRLKVNPLDGLGKARNSFDVVQDFAEALSQLPDGVEKSGLAIDFFGAKLGGKFIPLLNGGREGVQELVDEFYKLQTGFNKTQFKAGEKLNDTFSKLGTTIKGVRNQIGALFFDDTTAIGERLQTLVDDNKRSLIDYVKAIRDATATVFSGGADTEARDTRADSTLNTVQDLKTKLEAVRDVAVSVGRFFIAAFGAIKDGADQVANAINSIFGTKLTGAELLVGALVFKLIGGFRVLIGVLQIFGGVAGGVLVALGALLAANIAKWDDIKKAVTNVGAAIGKAFSGDFAGAFEELKKSNLATWTIIAADALAAIAGVRLALGALALAGAGGPIGWLILGGLTIGAAIGLFWDPIKAALVAAIQTGGEIWAGFKSDALQAWAEIGNGFSQAFQTAASLASGALATVSAGLQKVVDLARSAASAVGSIFSGAANGGGGIDAMGNQYASGGYVRGRGTGTSDSIPAWLSNGEFVVRAAAVRKYGLNLLHSLNGLSAPNFKFGMPAFAMGGLVSPVTVPSIGNAKGPSSVVNLTIGGETFAGLTASPDVAERLARYAAKRVVASAGRRPSWVGG